MKRVIRPILFSCRLDNPSQFLVLLDQIGDLLFPFFPFFDQMGCIKLQIQNAPQHANQVGHDQFVRTVQVKGQVSPNAQTMKIPFPGRFHNRIMDGSRALILDQLAAEFPSPIKAG